MCVREMRGLLLAALLGTACAYHPPVAPPPGILPKGPSPDTTGFGSWVIVRSADSLWVSGELIAITADSIHLLTEHGLVSDGTDRVVRVQVLTHDSEYGQIRTWQVAGTISALSHGVGFIFTGPIWIITGQINAASASRAGLLELRDWESLRLWARFPPGLPPSVDRSRLRLRARSG